MNIILPQNSRNRENRWGQVDLAIDSFVSEHLGSCLHRKKEKGQINKTVENTDRNTPSVNGLIFSTLDNIFELKEGPQLIAFCIKIIIKWNSCFIYGKFKLLIHINLHQCILFL